MAETKKCPYCGEEILSTAKKCKHCKEWLEVKETPKPFEPKDKVTAKSKNWGWMILFPLAIIIVIALVVYSLNSTLSSSISENEKLSSDDSTNIAIEQQEELENVIVEPAKDMEIEEVKRMLENSSYTKYSNARFGFSISYPDCFFKGEESENGDGCSFSLRYGIGFSVWGSYNISAQYGESVKEAYMKDNDKASASYKMQKDNWYVLSGKIDDEKYYYKKVVLMKGDTPQGSYVSFYLTFPKKFDTVLAGFINNVAKNFNPTYEGVYSHSKQDVEIIDPLKTMQIKVEKLPEKEKVQDYTPDQKLGLLLLMLAAFNSESGVGGSRNSYSCPSCGATFSDGQALSNHTNYTHGY